MAGPEVGGERSGGGDIVWHDRDWEACMADVLNEIRSSLEKRLRELEPMITEHAQVRRRLIVLCLVHSCRGWGGSGSWSRSIGCWQVWQRPVQHLRIGCISSTAFGSVRPAVGLKGSVARA